MEVNCRLSVVNKGGQGLVVGAGLDGARPHTYLQSMHNETTICSGKPHQHHPSLVQLCQISSALAPLSSTAVSKDVGNRQISRAT